MPRASSTTDAPRPAAVVLVAALALAACGGPSPDVLLVSVDTLRADAVASMPFLAGLAAEGRSFPRVYAASNWTLPSHASLFLSRPYSAHRTPRFLSRPPFPSAALPAGEPTLAEAFRDAGYRTFASVEGGFLDRSFGFDRGFDLYRQFPALAHDPRAELGDHLRALTAFLRDDPGGAPAFAFVHTYRVHDYFLNDPRFHGFLADGDAPWAARGPLHGEMLRSDGGEPAAAFLHRLYRGAAAEVDGFLAALVEGALAARPARRWLVVVTSDHGEAFHADALRRTHGSTLDDEQLLVPWIAWTSDRSLGPWPAAPLASGIDVAPSLLRRAGLRVPPSFLGRADLLETFPGARREPLEAAFFPYRVSAVPELQLAMVEPGRAVRVVATESGGTERCRIGGFDLSPHAAGRDDGRCRVLARSARERVRAWIGSERFLPRLASTPADAELTASLRSLGYL